VGGGGGGGGRRNSGFLPNFAKHRPVGCNMVSLFYVTNIVYFQRLLQLGLSRGSHVAVTCIAVGISFIIILFV